MNVRYRAELSQAKRDELTGMLSGAARAARKLKRAQILLGADVCVPMSPAVRRMKRRRDVFCLEFLSF
jgi:hypothetical protein